MDRLEAMSLLVAAVEAGSLSAAGRKLQMPLPTISRKIADLEGHLKAKLLVRSARNLTLTPAGEAYLAASRNILEQVNDAERAATGEYVVPKGRLIITSPIVLGRAYVLPVVTAFLGTFPEITADMVLTERYPHLIDEHVDIAFRLGRSTDSNSMISVGVGTFRRVVVGSHQYFAAHGTPKTPEALADAPCVTFADAVSGTPWMFQYPQQPPFQASMNRVRLTVNTAEAAIDAAIAGAGVTHVLSYQAKRYIDQGKLKVVLEDYEVEPMPISLVYRSDSLLPVKLRSFLEFAVPRLRGALLSGELGQSTVIGVRVAL